jgi:hypothetical protein
MVMVGFAVAEGIVIDPRVSPAIVRTTLVDPGRFLEKREKTETKRFPEDCHS